MSERLQSQSPAAPVILFAFRRPAHTERLLDSLQMCPESRDTHLFVFCDEVTNSSDEEARSQVLQVVSQVRGFRAVTLVEATSHKGLAKSVLEGVTTVLEQYDRCIVLEDDLVVADDFLTYMNSALEHFRHEPRVFSIQSHVFCEELNAPNGFFLPGAFSWGWATWRDRWRTFSPRVQSLSRLAEPSIKWLFDFGGTTKYSKFVKLQSEGQIDSWVILWYAHVFFSGGYSFFPPASACVNRGLDGSGTHEERSHLLYNTLRSTRRMALPTSPTLDREIIERHRSFFLALYFQHPIKRVFVRLLNWSRFRDAHAWNSDENWQEAVKRS